MPFSEFFEHLDPEVAEPLSRALEQLRRELRQELAGEPAETEPSPPQAPPSVEAGPELLEELKHGVVRIDAAGTQAEILTALLEGARRFCSRSALLLVRGGELDVWDAKGFGAEAGQVRELRFEPEAGSPWREACDGGGAVPLTGDDCAVLTGTRRGAPALGLLVPMMLGGRVAALVYADRADGDPSLSLTALQLLTFAAGSVLETLPVRSREATATLRLHLPSGVPGAEAEPAAGEEAIPETEIRPEPQIEAGGAEAEAPPAWELPAEPTDELTPAEVPPDAEPLGDAGLLDDAASEIDLAPPPHIPSIPIDSPAPPPEPEPHGEPAPEAEDLTEEIPAVRDEETEEEPSEAESEPADLDRSSTIVEPPSDVDGPGWAFSRASAAANQDAQVEEARRLARLLVTEIKLYNETQVELGRQNRDLYQRLQEDIERSRQIFEDRVETEVRDHEDFFQDALVRILAGGDADVLGR